MDVKQQLACPVRPTVRFDPGADAGGLSPSFVLGTFGLSTVLTAEEDETQQEGADGADRREDLRRSAEPFASQGVGPRRPAGSA